MSPSPSGFFCQITVSTTVFGEADVTTDVLTFRRVIEGNVSKDKGRGVRVDPERLQAVILLLWKEGAKA